MQVQPHDIGTFRVSSRGREGMEHIVDLAYQEEPWVKPHIMCSCEQCFCKGLMCHHIIAVLDFWRENVI